MLSKLTCVSFYLLFFLFGTWHVGKDFSPASKILDSMEHSLVLYNSMGFSKKLLMRRHDCHLLITAKMDGPLLDWHCQAIKVSRTTTSPIVPKIYSPWPSLASHSTPGAWTTLLNAFPCGSKPANIEQTYYAFKKSSSRFPTLPSARTGTIHTSTWHVLRKRK